MLPERCRQTSICWLVGSGVDASFRDHTLEARRPSPTSRLTATTNSR